MPVKDISTFRAKFDGEPNKDDEISSAGSLPRIAREIRVARCLRVATGGWGDIPRLRAGPVARRVSEKVVCVAITVAPRRSAR
jgi:hypothetical protein